MVACEIPGSKSIEAGYWRMAVFSIGRGFFILGAASSIECGACIKAKNGK